jgi:hypothetical protein
VPSALPIAFAAAASTPVPDSSSVCVLFSIEDHSTRSAVWGCWWVYLLMDMSTDRICAHILPTDMAVFPAKWLRPVQFLCFLTYTRGALINVPYGHLCAGVPVWFHDIVNDVVQPQ